MSVVGIDFGNSSCVAATVGRGGVDVVLNETSHRKTATMVSFQDKQRFIGEAAVPMARSNFKNTVVDLKRFIGLKFSSPFVQRELERFPFKLVAMENDEVGVEVMFNGAPTVFAVPRLVAMMIHCMKVTVEKSRGGPPVTDVVLSTPVYFTDAQRRAMLDACSIAGVNCLRLMNDTTAAALEYGIYKSAKRLFSDTEPQYVMFVDMGHSALQVAVVAFLQGRLSVMATAWDRCLGGRDYDWELACQMAEQFKARTGVDARGNKKAMLKLLGAVEKARKNLSPVGVTEAVVNVECVVGDNDLHAKITEDEFEQWTGHLSDRALIPLDAALQQAGLTASQLSSVEIIGGAIRMRSVKQRIAKHLGVPNQTPPNFGLSTTLNMDECVSRGCALQCAILSPLFKVKEFNIVDRVSLPVRLTWDAVPAAGMDVEGEEGEGEGAAVEVKPFDPDADLAATGGSSPSVATAARASEGAAAGDTKGSKRGSRRHSSRRSHGHSRSHSREHRHSHRRHRHGEERDGGREDGQDGQDGQDRHRSHRRDSHRGSSGRSHHRHRGEDGEGGGGGGGGDGGGGLLGLLRRRSGLLSRQHLRRRRRLQPQQAHAPHRRASAMQQRRAHLRGCALRVLPTPAAGCRPRRTRLRRRRAIATHHLHH
mmetsp:Transcript_28339/g.91800  ORF Transcript_28339/g.91800 Transcript_28339/m.91800 type:complete len:650 (+) Transcript_28339:49-1998(+)